MGIFGKHLAGAGYVVLNVIRAMNIISLLAVMAASAIMLVKIINNNSFFFFDAVEHVLRVVMCGFLLLTELPLFKSYFNRNWPLFSSNSGFVMLGVAMLLVGNSTLANLNKQQASREQLGLPFWRLVIGSGIVILIMGAINILASYIFRDGHQHLTARHVRSNGATASQKLETESAIAASTPKMSRRSQIKSLFLPHKHRDSLPSYKSQVGTNKGSIGRSQTVTSENPGSRTPPLNPYAISSPYAMTPGKHGFSGNNSNFPVSPSSKYSVDSPGMQRPNSAYHPANLGRPF